MVGCLKSLGSVHILPFFFNFVFSTYTLHANTYIRMKKNHVHFVRCHFSVTFLRLFLTAYVLLLVLGVLPPSSSPNGTHQSISSKFHFISQIKHQYECYIRIFQSSPVSFTCHLFLDFRSNLFEL